MTPANGESQAKVITRQRGVIDLNTMEEVLLKKQTNFHPVSTTEEALKRLNHNAAKFLEIVNEGLESEAGRALMADNTVPFMVEEENAEGVATWVPFTGVQADATIVNPLILNLAKGVFGYPSGEKGPEAATRKAAAKASAIELIKNTPAIRDGIKSQALKANG